MPAAGSAYAQLHQHLHQTRLLGSIDVWEKRCSGLDRLGCDPGLDGPWPDFLEGCGTGWLPGRASSGGRLRFLFPYLCEVNLAKPVDQGQGLI